MIYKDHSQATNSGAKNSFQSLPYDTKNEKKRKFDRDLLPLPSTYYSKEFPGLRIRSEWVKVLCPFHKDHRPSLNISMIAGNFRCWACGARGHDVLSFHQKRYQLNFATAVTQLGGWRYE